MGTGRRYGAMDCIECGCCTYICPSKRYLVHYIRLAKQKLLPLEVKLANDLGGAVVEETRFKISPSPHIRDEDSTPNIMLTVVVALLPVWIAATYFGFDSIRLVVLSSLSAIITEAICQKLRKTGHSLGW